MGAARIFPAAFICCLLSCLASGCYPGEKKEIDGSCKSYLECDSQGQFVSKSCGLLKRFDATKKACSWFWSVKCVDKNKECQDSKIYPHPDSCKLYYTCTGGRLTLQFCPILKVFDSSTSQCRFGWSCDKPECTASERRAVAGDCSAYDACDSGAWKRKSCITMSHFNAISQECEFGGCSQCTHGDVKTGSSCSSFQKCILGIWTEQNCPFAKRFNPDKKACVWFFQYTCPKFSSRKLLALADETCSDGETRAEEDCSTYSICDHSSWKKSQCFEDYLFDSVSLECVAKDKATCKSCPGDSPDYQSCGHYYACDAGKKTRKDCGFLKRWDGVTKKCVYMWKAKCFPGESCSENGKKVATEDCKQYKECISGNNYLNTCGFSRVFDSTKNRCVWVWPWHKCDNKHLVECSEGETKLLSCEQYVQCDGGKWVQRGCAPGETFKDGKCVKGECAVERKSCRDYVINGVSLECEEGKVFDLKTRSCVVGTCDDCKEGEKRRVGNSCKEYEVCIGGMFARARCSNCTNFDHKLGLCSFVWDCPCRGDGTTPKSPQLDTNVPLQLTSACKEGEKVPDKQDCRKYSICKNGNLSPHSCPVPMKFDSVDQECKLVAVRCA